MIKKSCACTCRPPPAWDQHFASGMGPGRVRFSVAVVDDYGWFGAGSRAVRPARLSPTQSRPDADNTLQRSPHATEVAEFEARLPVWRHIRDREEKSYRLPNYSASSSRYYCGQLINDYTPPVNN